MYRFYMIAQSLVSQPDLVAVVVGEYLDWSSRLSIVNCFILVMRRFVGED